MHISRDLESLSFYFYLILVCASFFVLSFSLHEILPYIAFMLSSFAFLRLLTLIDFSKGSQDLGNLIPGKIVSMLNKVCIEDRKKLINIFFSESFLLWLICAISLSICLLLQNNIYGMQMSDVALLVIIGFSIVFLSISFTYSLAFLNMALAMFSALFFVSLIFVDSYNLSLPVFVYSDAFIILKYSLFLFPCVNFALSMRFMPTSVFWDILGLAMIVLIILYDLMADYSLQSSFVPLFLGVSLMTLLWGRCVFETGTVMYAYKKVRKELTIEQN